MRRAPFQPFAQRAARPVQRAPLPQTGGRPPGPSAPPLSRRFRQAGIVLAVAAGACLLCQHLAGAEAAPTKGLPQQVAAPRGNTPGKLIVTVGKSLIIDSPLRIQRISLANGDLAEAVAVNPQEVLINGKAPGETSLIVWQQDGARLVYDLTVRMSPLKLDAVREQIARDFPDADINVTFENDTAFVRGTIKDVTSAQRVMAVVSTLGKAVDLMRVNVPPVEQQILLKVRFANVDRSAAQNLGVNWWSGAFNQATSIGTGNMLLPNGGMDPGGFTLSNAINIFAFRPDINLGAQIQALEQQNVLQILAEPNVMAINGKPASFLDGGQFPFPMVQGGANIGFVTIMWQEYGVRLNFLPLITPRGTIRLQVEPEVSSLDYNNAVTISGFTVPGLAVRRVQTEVELQNGQSFAIAGLLDKQTTENLSKIPGIGDLPLLGKLFQSKTLNRSNSELLVLITPELVKPIPAGQPLPNMNYPQQFMPDNTGIPSKLGNPAATPAPVIKTIPVEELIEQQKQSQPAGSFSAAPSQSGAVPMNPAQGGGGGMPMNPAQGSANSGMATAPPGGSGNR